MLGVQSIYYIYVVAKNSFIRLSISSLRDSFIGEAAVPALALGGFVRGSRIISALPAVRGGDNIAAEHLTRRAAPQR